jgi:glucose/mannose transport system permease protein
MPFLALGPAMLILAVCFYGCIAYTVGISFTSTRLLPRYDFVGWRNYALLLEDPRFGKAFLDLLVFGSLFIAATLVLGLVLALAIDAVGGRARQALQLIFVYPLSVSWLVTGLIWQRILNPGLGLEQAVHALGWAGFRFDWLVRPETALYTVVAAAVWHMAGLVMTLFLAGLHGIDPNIRRALRTEGVPRWRADLHVTIPMLRPYVVTSVLLLSFVVARTFDLVVAMTGGGPGFATDLPTLLIYDLMFPRSRAGTSAACAVVLMVTMTAVLAPYVAIEMRRRRA